MLLFLTLFFSFIYSAYSLRVFEINETEKISLGLQAEDPDADKLSYTFSKPLNNDGEWQTNYGDAGEYEATIAVSDGKESTSEDILIKVHKKEESPVISSFYPGEEQISISEGDGVKFEASAYDLNKDELSYKWLVDGGAVSESREMFFEKDYNGSGNYKIELIVSDALFSTSKVWDVEVKDVNLNELISQIKDVEILETETARLELPDFDYYRLKYTISEPLGDKNQWETAYDDAGEYNVKVNAEGKGFEGEKEVKVVVKNKDRKPQISGLMDITINENEEAILEVKADDPDGEGISLSAENIPEGASFEGSSFIWMPSYDFVQKNNAFDYLLDKFNVLSRSVEVVFRAQSNELSDEKKVTIRVKDANRPFVLEEIADVDVNEGGDAVIEPRYSDPDNDKVSFSYSGFMNSNKKKTGFDDAGLYVVKVVATDGFFSETMFVDIKVNDANRKPIFGKIEDVFNVNEGAELKVELSAKDEDNDAVSFSAKEMPKGAELRDNLFFWKPGFDAVNGTKKEFSADFIASDGQEEAEKKIKIIVNNVNQAPKIVKASNSLIAVKGKPILFEVDASDIDNDALAYEWDFGFFDKFKGEDKHQRIFSSKGKKTAKVTVSDGIEKVSKAWDVEVV